MDWLRHGMGSVKEKWQCQQERQEMPWRGRETERERTVIGERRERGERRVRAKGQDEKERKRQRESRVDSRLTVGVFLLCNEQEESN